MVIRQHVVRQMDDGYDVVVLEQSYRVENGRNMMKLTVLHQLEFTKPTFLEENSNDILRTQSTMNGTKKKLKAAWT